MKRATSEPATRILYRFSVRLRHDAYEKLRYRGPVRYHGTLEAESPIAALEQVSRSVDVDLATKPHDYWDRAASLMDSECSIVVVEDAPSETLDTSGWSLKRLSWAYGCSPKGSDEESELRHRLRVWWATHEHAGELVLGRAAELANLLQGAMLLLAGVMDWVGSRDQRDAYGALVARCEALQIPSLNKERNG